MRDQVSHPQKIKSKISFEYSNLYDFR
jgi:hypothetical protein